VFCEVDRLNERSGRRRADLAVNRAERLSLAERAFGDAGAWSVHTLISRTMRFRDPKPERSEELRDAAVRVLTTAFRENAEDPRDHAELEPVVAHVRELVDQADDLKTADLAGGVARYDHERGAYGLAETLYRREWEITRQIRGDEHPYTLASVNNLALMLQEQGDLAEAQKIQEEVLGIQRRILGAEHPDTLTTIINLAGTLKAQGDLDGAREKQERVLEIQRRTRGDEHPDTMASMNYLAVTFQEQGDLAEAREIHVQLLEMRRRILGDGHPDTLTSMNNFAGTLRVQGDLDEARKIYGEVLEIQRRILGDGHPDTTVSAWNLFFTLHARGDSIGARTVLKNNLLWLLDRDPASLGADQRQIRELVSQINEQAE
jgi:tetratricopeptide (TPR) repeat protein